MSAKLLENPARTRLEAGELALGLGLRHARVIDMAMVAKTAGMDWLFIDLEHGAMDVETAAQISIAGLLAGVSPICRVPNGDLTLAGRLLDSGAWGIVMPHVESAEEARRMVKALRFAPLGERGISASIPQVAYDKPDLARLIPELNRSTLLTVMIETPEAVERADEIAAVEGIDSLMIGTNDLAMASGKPGNFDDKCIVDAYEKVGRACAKYGKWLGSGGLTDVGHFRKYCAMGARFLLAGQDLGFIMAGTRQRVSDLRQIDLPR